MNLMDLMIRIGVEDEASSGLSRIVNNAESNFNKLSTGIQTTVKATSVAVAGMTAGVGALTKLSIDSYSQYEQLAGGVETLFKSSADKIKAFSDKAYKTAGMSANQYMDTAIKSSAALIRSLNGDTAKAAEIADMAITDMADNANKMGTSLQSLQYAYTGFSRGNFTMLDNLALGFSGTKEGMEELLATAKELTGIDYNIDSYADIVQAIHAIQEEMEITGTTAKEAAGTISGSVASAGAAWDNFLTGVADGNADLEQLTDNLVDSVFTVANNVLPRIGQAVDGIVTSFGRLLGFDLSGVAEKVSAFGNNVVTVSKNIMSAFKEGGVFGVFGEITEMIQTVVGVDLSWVSEKFNVLGTAIRNVQDAFMEGGIDGGLSAFMREFAGLTGVDISGVVEGVKGFIGAVSGAAPEIIDNVGRAIDAVLKPFGSPDAQAIIDNISNSIHTFVGWIEEADFTWIASVGDGISKLIEPIVSAAPEVIENVKKGVQGFFGVIFGADGVSLKGIADSVVTLFSPLTSDVASAAEVISRHFAEIMEYARENGFGDNLRVIAGAAMELFGSFTSGLGGLISASAEAIGFFVGQFAQDDIDRLNSFAGVLTTILNVLRGLTDLGFGTVADFISTLTAKAQLEEMVKSGQISYEDYLNASSQLAGEFYGNLAVRTQALNTGKTPEEVKAELSSPTIDLTVPGVNLLPTMPNTDKAAKEVGRQLAETVANEIVTGAAEYSTGHVGFAESASGKAAVGLGNTILAASEVGDSTLSVNVYLDGEQVARNQYGYLKDISKQKGDPVNA